MFGWILFGVFSASSLGDRLVLKGGNGFRKAYFPNTRFSNDLDLSTESAINPKELEEEFNRVCQFVQKHSGVEFDVTRNTVELQQEIDNRRSVWGVKLYFRDFYGNPDKFTIKVGYIRVSQLTNCANKAVS